MSIDPILPIRSRFKIHQDTNKKNIQFLPKMCFETHKSTIVIFLHGITVYQDPAVLVLIQLLIPY